PPPLMTPPPPPPTLFPYTTLFRSRRPRRRTARQCPAQRRRSGGRYSQRIRSDRDGARLQDGRNQGPQAHGQDRVLQQLQLVFRQDRKSTRLNSSHLGISYAVFCLK